MTATERITKPILNPTSYANQNKPMLNHWLALARFVPNIHGQSASTIGSMKLVKYVFYNLLLISIVEQSALLCLTPSELQSRFGDKAAKFQVICPQLPPKRDCSPKRVNPFRTPLYTNIKSSPIPNCPQNGSAVLNCI